LPAAVAGRVDAGDLTLTADAVIPGPPGRRAGGPSAALVAGVAALAAAALAATLLLLLRLRRPRPEPGRPGLTAVFRGRAPVPGRPPR
jgi:hypothetical protein